ncbi:MAG: hypothetical protein ABEK17_01350 [Candidatus Aenigmatarchaeota archaeon]
MEKNFSGLKKLLRSEQKALLLFPLTVLLFAPLTHEFFHVLMLEIFECPYSSEFLLLEGEIWARIIPLCVLTKPQALIVLAAGMIGNILLGTVLFMVSSCLRIRASKKKGYIKSFYISILSLGFLFPVSFSFFNPKGDVTSIIKVLEIEFTFYWRILIGFTIIILTILRFWIDYRAVENEYSLRHFLRSCEVKLKEKIKSEEESEKEEN